MKHQEPSPFLWTRLHVILRWPQGTKSGAAYRSGSIAVMSALEAKASGFQWHVSVSKAVDGKRVLPSDEEMQVVREDFEMHGATEDNTHTCDGLVRHLWLTVNP